ncbi:Gp55 [Listeria monocytogenes]|nr:Gp55 [Listeria monocytogenes]CUL50700.1 Gp55 [Listeria monocytogenes]CUL77854.1 Gp55 [Listeria monocytogenes]CUM02102.1 Gp55 [Listeria monocytogenes]CUM07763.1 Gp55 [Listeria monocytogenes]
MGGGMNDKKVRFYVSTGMHGSLETETFLLKTDLNIEFDILTLEQLEKEITEAYDDWLVNNIDSGWSIEKEVAE